MGNPSFNSDFMGSPSYVVRITQHVPTSASSRRVRSDMKTCKTVIDCLYGSSLKFVWRTLMSTFVFQDMVINWRVIYYLL